MNAIEQRPAIISPDIPLDPTSHIALAYVNYRGLLERLPKWLICIPLALQWIVLSLRYRSATLPSAVNPAITAGGLVGEGKLEYFRNMGPLARAAVAPYCSVSTHRLPSVKELWRLMANARLTFPIIAKPNLGLCGYGVQRLENLGSLQLYLSDFPTDEAVILQKYLPQEGEAGIFYARDPHTGQGRIIGLAMRYFPRVTGDGQHTVSDLIAGDPRAHQLVLSPKHSSRTFLVKHVPAIGEIVRLATICSTRIGALYRNGNHCITPQLTAAIDAIASDMPEFHCGRFDVRFEHLTDLCAGHGFIIMEINGAGSEAIQAWDPDTGIFSALQMIFFKQAMLFAIGAAQRRKGFKPIGLIALARLFFRQQRLIALYPSSN